MLDVALRNVSFTYGVRDVSVTFARSTHTAIIGPPGCGSSTLLRLIAGKLRPSSGEIRIGAREVTNLAPGRRPLLFVTSEIDVPSRWSLRHLRVAAVRQRSLDREDRHHEYELAIKKWDLTGLIERPLRTLSSSEKTRAHLARIELLRPAVLIADRLLEAMNASAISTITDEFYRTLRVIGTTVISAPATIAELGLTDRVIVLDGGRVVQEDLPSRVYRRPLTEAAAQSIGEVNIVPITIRGGVVESPIGSWEVGASPVEGRGIALVRPEDFSIAQPGEESDLIFGIEEASFRDGHWLASGILSGGLTLRVSLPGDLAVHKGRLIPLRFDSSRFVLLRHDG